METLSRAVRNFVTLIGQQAVTWIATLAFTSALGHNLGDSGFGVLYLALSFVSLFEVIVNFGLETLITREIARYPEKLSELLFHGATIKTAFGLVCLGAIQVGAHALNYPEMTRQVLTICSLTLVVTAWSSLIAAIYTGLTRLGHTAIGAMLEKVLTAAIGIAVLARGGDVVAIAWVLFASACVKLAWQAIAISPHVRLDTRLSIRTLQDLVVRALPFVGSWLLVSIYWKIDAVMLSKMTSDEVVGWYGASYRLIETLIIIPTIIASKIAEPLLARLSRTNPATMKLVFEKELSYLIAAGVPICVGLALLAGPILVLIFGSEFEPGAPALQVLAAGLLVLFVNSAVGGMLVSLNLERRFALVTGITAALNVGLNFLLIPHWQHVGAAIATLLSELAVSVGFYILLPRNLLPHALIGVSARAALAAIGMALVVSAASAAGVPVTLLVPLGAVVYASLALALRVVPTEDFAMLRQAIRQPRVQATPEGLGRS